MGQGNRAENAVSFSFARLSRASSLEDSMDLSSRIGAVLRSDGLRKWAIRIGVTLLVFEVFYVVGANFVLRTNLLTNLINRKPEKTNISWDSAVTYLPGFATVKGFTLRSQTPRDQVYVHVAEADARISLIKLAFKTIHIRDVDAKGVDFRYRERLDSPKRSEAEEGLLEPPVKFEFYPEIPGFSNPPDPKPEDLYPRKKKKRPWTIRITDADVEGPVKVALNEFRLEGEGSVGGGVTVKPRKTITIHRGRLGLDAITVSVGPEVVTDNLSITSDLQFGTFPAKGAKLSDVIGNISGTLFVAGRLGDKAAVSQEITPGITTLGAGIIAANLRFKNGILRAGSEYSLQSDAFHVMIMGLDASGSASVSGDTVKDGGEHLTSLKVAFGDFEFVAPDDDHPAITGTGLEMTAQWKGPRFSTWTPTRSSTRSTTARKTDSSGSAGRSPTTKPLGSARRVRPRRGPVRPLRRSDTISSASSMSGSGSTPTTRWRARWWGMCRRMAMPVADWNSPRRPRSKPNPERESSTPMRPEDPSARC